MKFNCACGSSTFILEDRGSKYTYPRTKVPEYHTLEWGGVWSTCRDKHYYAHCTACKKEWGPFFSTDELEGKLKEQRILI